MTGKREIAVNLLRVVSGFLLACHGYQKLFGAFGQGPQPLMGLLGAAGVLEFLGGSLILFGFFTRPVAFILSGEMAFAYWMVHGHQAPLPIQNGGEPAALFCFIFLFLWANGGGAFSVDGQRGRL